jgi:hypothetical protein
VQWQRRSLLAPKRLPSKYNILNSRLPVHHLVQNKVILMPQLTAIFCHSRLRLYISTTPDGVTDLGTIQSSIHDSYIISTNILSSESQTLMALFEGGAAEASSNALPNQHSIPLPKAHDPTIIDHSEEWEYEYSTTEAEVGFTVSRT